MGHALRALSDSIHCFQLQYCQQEELDNNGGNRIKRAGHSPEGVYCYKCLYILSDCILGLLLRHALGGGDEWKGEDLDWVALPMRTLTCLSMPLVLPKLITAIGSMDLKEGGKTLGRVLIFYGAFNLIIESSGILIFHLVIPNNEHILTSSITKTQPDEVVSHLPFSFAMQDLAFNLAPDNVFTAPFRRFRTQVDAVEGKVTFSDGFSLDPNILGLVIVSSALGVAIAK